MDHNLLCIETLPILAMNLVKDFVLKSSMSMLRSELTLACDCERVWWMKRDYLVHSPLIDLYMGDLYFEVI